MGQKTIVVVAGYALSLIKFREPLLRELMRRGYRVITCAPPDMLAQEQLTRLGVTFLGLPMARASMNPLTDSRYAFQLYRLFRSAAPVAVLTYTAKPVIWGSLAAIAARVPRRNALITGLGFAFTGGRGFSRLLVNRALRWLYKRALSVCQRVAFQNADDQAEFVSLGLARPERTFVVNGSGVDLHAFAPVPVPATGCFLLIARLLSDKGIREYAQAARRLRRKWPEARFRLVGWFDENPTALSKREVEEWVRAGDIEYGGHLQDVRPELHGCTVYVLPSYREGTPRTVLEAMAVGRAIVTTDAPGCRETVEDGWNGFLVPVRDVDALVEAMERFLIDSSLAATMGLRSRELAESKYDANRVAKALADGMEI